MNHLLDYVSLKLTALTIFCGIFFNLSKDTIGSAAGAVTIVAGLTTIIYNVVKVSKEIKQKKQ